MLKESKGPSDEPAVIALQALSYVAGNPEILGRFMALTGAGPEAVRGRLEDPSFHLAILDFLMGDESLLLAFAADHNLNPQRITRIHAQLQGEFE